MKLDEHWILVMILQNVCRGCSRWKLSDSNGYIFKSMHLCPIKNALNIGSKYLSFNNQANWNAPKYSFYFKVVKYFLTCSGSIFCKILRLSAEHSALTQTLFVLTIDSLRKLPLTLCCKQNHKSWMKRRIIFCRSTYENR